MRVKRTVFYFFLPEDIKARFCLPVDEVLDRIFVISNGGLSLSVVFWQVQTLVSSFILRSYAYCICVQHHIAFCDLLIVIVFASSFTLRYHVPGCQCKENYYVFS